MWEAFRIKLRSSKHSELSCHILSFQWKQTETRAHAGPWKACDSVKTVSVQQSTGTSPLLEASSNGFPALALGMRPTPSPVIIATLFRGFSTYADNCNQQAPLDPIKGHPIRYLSSFNMQIKLLKDLVTPRAGGWAGPGPLHSQEAPGHAPAPGHPPHLEWRGCHPFVPQCCTLALPGEVLKPADAQAPVQKS